MEDKLSKCIAFRDYLELSRVVMDKVAFLTLVFKRLNPDAIDDDLINTGGRIARLWGNCHKDTGYLLKVIWEKSSDNPIGSKLNYLQGTLTKKAVVNNKPVNSNKYPRLS